MPSLQMIDLVKACVSTLHEQHYLVMMLKDHFILKKTDEGMYRILQCITECISLSTMQYIVMNSIFLTVRHVCMSVNYRVFKH